MNFLIDLDAIIDGGSGKPKRGSIAALVALQDAGYRVVVVGDSMAIDDDWDTIDAAMVDAGGSCPRHLPGLVPGPLIVVADGTADDPPAVVVLTAGQGVEVLRKFVEGLP